MNRMKHPLTGAIYERQDDGTVLVTEPGGRQGRFQPSGQWVDGEVRAADPHVCDFVGGRRPGEMV